MEISKVKSLIDYRPKATNQSGPPAADISAPSSPQKPRLLDQVRQAIRARQYSPRTEEAYVGWIKRFKSFQSFESFQPFEWFQGSLNDSSDSS